MNPAKKSGENSSAGHPTGVWVAKPENWNALCHVSCSALLGGQLLPLGGRSPRANPDFGNGTVNNEGDCEGEDRQECRLLLRRLADDR